MSRTVVFALFTVVSAHSFDPAMPRNPYFQKSRPWRLKPGCFVHNDPWVGSHQGVNGVIEVLGVTFVSKPKSSLRAKGSVG